MKHFRIVLIISVLTISFLVILLTGCKTYEKIRPARDQFSERNKGANDSLLMNENPLGKTIAVGFLMLVTTVAFIAIVRQVNKV